MKAKLIMFPTNEEKKKLTKICDEVIDILYNKHKLSPIKCAFVLKFLQESFDKTMRGLWISENKEILGK